LNFSEKKNRVIFQKDRTLLELFKLEI